MGMGPEDLVILAGMKNAGYLTGLRAVCDLGAQELRCHGNPAFVEDFLRAFGAAPLPSTEKLTDLATCGTARELWEMCGIEYTAIDAAAELPALNLDLNFDSVPSAHRGRYQLVTNFGTSEHVGNQLNAMKIMHDLCARGGVMFHDLPFSGYQNHGFVRYNPRFFWCLCRSNNYACIDLQMDFSGDVEGLHPEISQTMESYGHSIAEAGEFSTKAGAIRFLMRKRDHLYFRPPFDGIAGAPADAYPRLYAGRYASRFADMYANDRAAALAERPTTAWEDATYATAFARSALRKATPPLVRGVVDQLTGLGHWMAAAAATLRPRERIRRVA
jgi:hypothetical protein